MDLSNRALLLCPQYPHDEFSVLLSPQFLLTCIHLPQDLAVGSEHLRIFAEICCFKKIQLFWSWGTSHLQITLKVWFFLYCFQLSRMLKLLTGREFCLCLCQGFRNTTFLWGRLLLLPLLWQSYLYAVL